jgi:hypothetical protein
LQIRLLALGLVELRLQFGRGRLGLVELRLQLGRSGLGLYEVGLRLSGFGLGAVQLRLDVGELGVQSVNLDAEDDDNDCENEAGREKPKKRSRWSALILTRGCCIIHWSI